MLKQINSSVLKKIVIVIIVLLSINFYKLIFVTGTIARLSALAAAIIVIVLLVFHSVYFKIESNVASKKFLIPIVLMFISPFLGMIVAYFYHGQSFLLSFYISSPMYLFLFYFLLHRWKIDPDFLFKLIVIFGLIYVAIYFIQWSVFPTRILNSRVEYSRGTVRIFFPGSVYAFYSYFLLILMVTTEKFKWTLLIQILLTYSVMTFLQGTRSSILLVTGSTALYFIFGKHIRNKLLNVLMVLIVMFCAILLFRDIFIGLYEQSLEESERVSTNPRLLANRFFLGEFMPAKIAYIFGNGADHGASLYGQKIALYKMVYGYYQSDIGLVGAYSKYGLFFVIGYLSVLIYFTFSKLPKKMMIVRYMFLSAWFSIFSGGPSMVQSQGTVGLCLLLYMIDVYSYKEKKLTDYYPKQNK